MKKEAKECYFITSVHDLMTLEQIIKAEEKIVIFQVVVKNASDIKRLTWFFLTHGVNFERKSLGSGITIFYVDKTVPFFMKKKDKKSNKETK